MYRRGGEQDGGSTEGGCAMKGESQAKNKHGARGKDGGFVSAEALGTFI